MNEGRWSQPVLPYEAGQLLVRAAAWGVILHELCVWASWALLRGGGFDLWAACGRPLLDYDGWTGRIEPGSSWGLGLVCGVAAGVLRYAAHHQGRWRLEAEGLRLWQGWPSRGRLLPWEQVVDASPRAPAAEVLLAEPGQRPRVLRLYCSDNQALSRALHDGARPPVPPGEHSEGWEGRPERGLWQEFIWPRLVSRAALALAAGAVLYVPAQALLGRQLTRTLFGPTGILGRSALFFVVVQVLAWLRVRGQRYAVDRKGLCVEGQRAVPWTRVLRIQCEGCAVAFRILTNTRARWVRFEGLARPLELAALCRALRAEVRAS